MSLVLVNITETSQFDRTCCDYRRNLFIFLHHFGAFLRSVAKQFYNQYSRYIDNVAGLIFIFFESI